MINLLEILNQVDNYNKLETYKCLDIPDTNSRKYFPQYDNKNIYWIENDLAKNGLSSVIRMNENSEITNLTGKKYNVKSKVHEYGGIAYIVNCDRVFFVNSADQNIYLIKDDQISQITTFSNLRIGDLEIYNNFLYFVVEDHNLLSNGYPLNYIASLDIENPNEIKKVVYGSSFYSNPRISIDGRKLLWLQWDLPNMPWEASELFIADIDKKQNLGTHEKIDGGQETSIFQPEWNRDNSIFFIKEEGDKGKLFHYKEKKINLTLEIPVDLLRPLWILGLSSYKVIKDDLILTCGWDNGYMKYILIDILKNNYIEFDFDIITDELCITDEYILMAGSSEKYLNQIFYIEKNLLEINSKKLKKNIPKKINILPINNSYITHFLPTNNIYVSPPVILKIHSGPTAHSNKGFSPERNYWTKKGFGIIEIDYRGSTSYGIKFRRSLNGKWGIYDTEDVLDVIEYILEKNMYDHDKLILKGSSAGGFTLLNVLCETKRISCASCYYGVSDLENLLNETHKFESGYTRTLIGEDNILLDRKNLFKNRSPICKVNNIDTPIIFFQGLDDHVVPAKQTDQIYNKLQSNGINSEMHLFQNEGHGFKNEAIISECMKLEEKFYEKNLNIQRIH